MIIETRKKVKKTRLRP